MSETSNPLGSILLSAGEKLGVKIEATDKVFAYEIRNLEDRIIGFILLLDEQFNVMDFFFLPKKQRHLGFQISNKINETVRYTRCILDDDGDLRITQNFHAWDEKSVLMSLLAWISDYERTEKCIKDFGKEATDD